MPKLLDLFCGAGGAAMGYHRAGFEIVGVDLVPQPNYPFEFIISDALTYPLKGFDIIHASPPCQTYIRKSVKYGSGGMIHPTRIRLLSSKLPYIIENVETAPLINTIKLCGTMFDLLVLRHRLFESNLQLKCDRICNHWGTVSGGDFAGVYGFGGRGQDWSLAMGIDWMTELELKEAVPPAYTEFLGKQVIRKL